MLLGPVALFSQSDAETYARFLTDPGIAVKIQSILDHLATDPGLKIAGEKIHNIEFVTSLYRKNNYLPFWTELQYADDALNGIQMSYQDGLIPLDYHLEAILATKDELISHSTLSEEKIAKAAGLELMLTDGIIYYADHLLYGKCDPVTLVPTWNFGYAPVPEINPVDFREAIVSRELVKRLKKLRPEIPLYDTLVTTLALYRAIESNGGWSAIPSGGKIEPGDRDQRIVQVRQRLMITGELASEDTAAGTLYDGALESAVRSFQSTHGLDADGIIGGGTFRELNIPVDERIETIRINLERVRWVTHDLPQQYLIVNIAAFWLVMVRDGSIDHQARVVVGKPYTKTPIFRDRMRYIDFNPTWTVPRSIIKNEIIPKLKKDSLYLQRNNMVLLDSKGNEVPESSLDIPNLSAGKFPYLVRQQPGPDNALGVVKFMFPNEYDIYLHDTPSKSLFSKASRAYSHGCIRVEKPLDLAVKLLQGTEWTRERIDRTIQTRETTRVPLPEPLDILIMYWTCGLDRNRKVFFAPDIYDRDNEVLRQLDQLMR